MEEKERKTEERNNSRDKKQNWVLPKLYVLNKEKTEGGTGGNPTEEGLYES